MGEIKPFPGAPVRQGAPPCINKDLVAFLEDLLARAHRGDLRALAVATVSQRDVITTAWSPPENPCSHMLMAGIGDLQYRFARGRFGEDEEV